MSYTANARILKQEIDTNRAAVAALDAAGGLVVKKQQSDKLGFDWECYYVNEILVRRVYAEQSVPTGTAQMPILWTEGVYLIPNGYYIHDGVRKVWTGAAGIPADWEDPAWTEF